METTRGAVVGWRLRAELVGQLDKEYAEHLERRAGRIAGARLLGLSVYIVVDAGRRLLGFGHEAHESRLRDDYGVKRVTPPDSRRRRPLQTPVTNL